MKRSTLYSIAAVLAVGRVLFHDTARAKVECRVCMSTRSDQLRAAVGQPSRRPRGAQSNAAGRLRADDQQIGCGRTEPVRSVVSLLNVSTPSRVTSIRDGLNVTSFLDVSPRRLYHCSVSDLSLPRLRFLRICS